jgi:hypothetical protein
MFLVPFIVGFEQPAPSQRCQEVFGLDARDPAFWQIGLTMIEGMMIELESLKSLDRRTVIGGGTSGQLVIAV